VLRHERGRPDDITVLIGVRNRADHRLANALESLRAQTLPRGSLRVSVLDYGSEPAASAETRALCRRYDVECLRIDDAPVWSRSRCLNVGIRRAETKFLVTSDVDIVFSPRYLADAIETLKRRPLSVVCSPMLDLPQEAVACFKRAAENGEAPPVGAWKERCSARLGWELHPSIAATYTAFLRLVRGYDEYYAVWGYEDLDLMRRLECLGLRRRKLDTQSFYLHQWHPKFEDVQGGELAEQIRRNRAHLDENRSILRNGPGWGLR
jgi:hypothetical protein